jgi:hypothetical protein
MGPLVKITWTNTNKVKAAIKAAVMRCANQSRRP